MIQYYNWVYRIFVISRRSEIGFQKIRRVVKGMNYDFSRIGWVPGTGSMQVRGGGCAIVSGPGDAAGAVPKKPM